MSINGYISIMVVEFPVKTLIKLGTTFFSTLRSANDADSKNFVSKNVTYYDNENNDDNDDANTIYVARFKVNSP